MNEQNKMSTPWRVLIVDDLPKWGDSISSMASLFDCDVRVTTNLSAAVRELARWQPQLIILDLHMPRDEWEPVPQLALKYKPNLKTLAFCEQVTTHPQLSHVLVAMVSVENQLEQQALALEAGAHFFYTKGEFNVEKFDFLLSQLTAESPVV
jgi:CheY-like chemotaxis protein